MSDTVIDMAKVTQMLDAGWSVSLFKNQLKTYTAAAFRRIGEAKGEETDTDDFTPEQALTRLAYKVHGEIL
jgi:hypothetical protein